MRPQVASALVVASARVELGYISVLFYDHFFYQGYEAEVVAGCGQPAKGT